MSLNCFCFLSLFFSSLSLCLFWKGRNLDVLYFFRICLFYFPFACTIAKLGKSLSAFFLHLFLFLLLHFLLLLLLLNNLTLLPFIILTFCPLQGGCRSSVNSSTLPRSRLDYKWQQTASIDASCHVTSLSWNLEGTRLLTAGDLIQMWFCPDLEPNSSTAAMKSGAGSRSGGEEDDDLSAPKTGGVIFTVGGGPPTASTPPPKTAPPLVNGGHSVGEKRQLRY